MSERRLEEFRQCKSSPGSTALRHSAGVSNGAVEYDVKLSSADACKVGKWLKQNGVRTAVELLKPDGMQTVSKLLCRWPRPSELASMAFCLGYKDVVYYRDRKSVV